MVVQVNERSPVIASTANLCTLPTPLHHRPQTRLFQTRACLPFLYRAFTKRHNDLAYLPDLTVLEGDQNGSSGSTAATTDSPQPTPSAQSQSLHTLRTRHISNQYPEINAEFHRLVQATKNLVVLDAPGP